MKKTISLIFTFLLIMQGSSMSLLAQEITEKDVEKSKLEKEYAENQKAIAEAKKAELDAKFPKPDASALVGGTTVNEGTFIETQMLGYCAMKIAAQDVRNKLKNLPSLNQNEIRQIDERIQVIDRELQSETRPSREREKKLNDEKNWLNERKWFLLKTPAVFVYSDSDVKMLSRYKLMLTRLKNLEKGYNEIVAHYLSVTGFDEDDLPSQAEIRAEVESGSTTRSLAFLPSLVTTALNYLTLLKTDVEITPSEINIGEKELVAEVFNGLENLVLYYPQRIPLSIQDCEANSLEECSPLLQQIFLTHDAYLKANYVKDVIAREFYRLDEIEKIEKDEKELAELLKKPAPTDAERQRITVLQQKIQQYNQDFPEDERKRNKALAKEPADKIGRLNNLFNITMKELGFAVEEKKEEGKKEENPEKKESCPDKSCSQTTNVNVTVGEKEKKDSEGGGGNSSLFSYLQAESLNNVMNRQISYWLDLQVIKAGGNTRVKSNIITNFMLGSRVNFSGGALVYFNVFDTQGASRMSGVVNQYKKYRKSSKINDTCSVKEEKGKKEE